MSFEQSPVSAARTWQDELEDVLSDDPVYGSPVYLSLLNLVLSSKTYLPGEYAEPDATGRRSAGGGGTGGLVAPWDSGQGLMERLSEMPLSVDELCHVFLATIEVGFSLGFRV